MDTFVVWAIIALFYAPLHFLPPALIVFFRHAGEPGLRRERLIATALDCTFSMAAAFGLVVSLAGQDISVAMLVLLVSMFTPYIRLFLLRPRSAELAMEEAE
ncbi:MAG: hypothetical protein A2286_04395 [Gammaproteobacteria bacterium RIFOXYA12_FULL_61_12]|nr:MAG: hypothetical protein A2514_09465 [Gammaproteobacteria bacterium RIFOXYD12_FULL_61_37]OGT93636.1 MAG: hypothetical protein A2286_04395 [Gammaproteobacteria bacterium RIFOXYA12_FULL_61_12]